MGIIVEDYRQTRTLQLQASPSPVQLNEPLETSFAVGRLPTRSESILGAPQEPISLIVLAKDEASFLEAIRKAGWQLADQPSLGTMSRAALSAWFNREYITAPVTPAFWNGKPQDFGFEAETTHKSLRQRHHARFWKTGFRTINGSLIFVGTASFDDGLRWVLTHHIDPNIDAERDFLATDLQNTGLVSSKSDVQLVAPVLGQNLTGDPFFTDGKAILLQLKPELDTNTVKPEPKMPK